MLTDDEARSLMLRIMDMAERDGGLSLNKGIAELKAGFAVLRPMATPRPPTPIMRIEGDGTLTLGGETVYWVPPPPDCADMPTGTPDQLKAKVAAYQQAREREQAADKAKAQEPYGFIISFDAVSGMTKIR